VHQVKIVEKQVKNTKVNGLLRVYPLLIDIIRAKRSLVVKARDVKLIFGIDSHGKVTWIGRLLKWLVLQGYAIKLNNARPVRYKLVPKDMWQWMAEQCDFQCLNDGTTCRLIGLCPYWKLLEVKSCE